MISTTNYKIVFDGAAMEGLRQKLDRGSYSAIWVLTDENTKIHCLPILEAELPDIDFKNIHIRAGEFFKNIDTCQFIWQQLLEGKADRKALFLNLGGGVIGDMGGFCAATFKRGIDFVQIPTTLLSQVDASVGGKLGIDFLTVKNAVGLFQQPSLVCIYPPFLKTLPERELYSGFAEVIKHALIADAAHWAKLQAIPKLSGQEIDWAGLISHSIHIKNSIVTADPLEKGLRKVLNFGHTIGHAVESLSWETSLPLLHGEAVAIGMLCEAYLSVKSSGLQEEKLHVIQQCIRNLYPVYDLSFFDKTELLHLMKQDKKNEAGQISFSLLKDIGQATYDVNLPDDLILESLDYAYS